MSVLKIKSKDLDLELVLDGDAQVATSGQNASPKAEDAAIAAVIALALSQELGAGAEHDEESGVITIQNHPTQWNAKMFGFNNVTLNRK